MLFTPPLAGKLALAALLVIAIALAARARAPRRRAAPSDLRRLVLSVLVLYAVGLVALLDGHATLSTVAFAAGVATAALAAWLSRGADSDDPPGGGDPPARVPPPDPDGVPRWDWERFDRERRTWTLPPRQPTASR